MKSTGKIAGGTVLVVLIAWADSAEVIFQRAASALASQNYEAAEQGFRAVLKLEPNNIGALGNLGVVYSRSRRYSEAISTYRRALRIAPGDQDLVKNLGLAYLKQEQFAAALPIFKKLAAAGNNLQARELLATCRLSLGQYQNAVTVLEPLAREEPENSGVFYMLGVALTRLKRADEAHQAFARMMESASAAQANYLMGKASYDTGAFEEAANFLRKTLAAEPGFDGAHRELGKVLISLRDSDGAERELRTAGSDDADALYYLGGLLAQTRPSDAIPVLKRSQELNPDAWGPLYYLGKIDVEQGRAKDGLPLLERAARLNPEEAAVQYQLGRALQKTGREAEARAAFARVKEIKGKGLRNEADVLSLGRP